MIHYFYGTLQVGIGQTLCSFEHVSCCLSVLMESISTCCWLIEISNVHTKVHLHDTTMLPFSAGHSWPLTAAEWTATRMQKYVDAYSNVISTELKILHSAMDKALTKYVTQLLLVYCYFFSLLKRFWINWNGL